MFDQLPAQMEVTMYKRICIKDLVVHSKVYTREVKRNSYTVMYGQDKFGFVEEYLLVEFDEGNIELCALIQKLKFKEYLGVAEHIAVVEKGVGDNREKQLVAVTDIKKICVFVEITDLDVDFVSVIPYNFLIR